MMPVARKPAPRDPALNTCIEVYRKQAKTEPISTVWKRFRASTCGGSWIDALQSAYGHRCLYCDHAEGRSIDHRDAKSTSIARAFAWDNFRPSCLGCNNLKGTLAIVDPVSEDPRRFIEYDVSTGKPAPSPTATPATKEGRDHDSPRRLANTQRGPAGQAAQSAAGTDRLPPRRERPRRGARARGARRRGAASRHRARSRPRGRSQSASMVTPGSPGDEEAPDPEDLGPEPGYVGLGLRVSTSPLVTIPGSTRPGESALRPAAGSHNFGGEGGLARLRPSSARDAVSG